MLEKLEYILVMKVMILLNWRDKRGGRFWNDTSSAAYVRAVSEIDNA